MAKVFVALKILFPQGNTKLTTEQRKKILLICEIKDLRTLNKCIEDLEIKLNWIWYDTRTKNYNIRSFYCICHNIKLEYNYGHQISETEVKIFNAWLGGVIFNICRISYWNDKIKRFKNGLKELTINKVVYYLIPQKGKGCVRQKGSNNKTLSFSYLTLEPAPIALNGISKYFRLNKTKVSRLKKLAETENFISVEHCFEEANIPKENINLYLQHADDTKYIKVINGKVMFVNIDIITTTNLTRKRLKKRKL